VAVARALAASPRALLADEPTGDLDTATEADIMAIFEELHRDGLTLVLVTHSLDLRRFATRWLEMSDGHLTEHEL
jgi:putative ABC transport system ATP-binding protein